jgi:eukaryotic-like serine/threonine-protein kinase
MSSKPDDELTRTEDAASASTSEEHTVIGAYRVLRHIGEGGMGEVWLAEQQHPLRRQVALKLIKPGMDSRQVVARFEAERQALALMDHPAIATVFDGGTTPGGRPYFAMEYVKGEPITIYCDRLRLSTEDRLSLFIQVCEGVQHAHQKGVIHRDLKPSNLLVTIREEGPVPKIIDFGVAKATSQPLTDHPLYTAIGAMIGTPEYMSPEQAESGGLDIDTRTDIYALGVILYELLTGAVPLGQKELRPGGLTEMTRVLRDIEPPRPSTRITQLGPESAQIAERRRTQPHKLASSLRGDLDWITMKALDKDRTRRYATASALAADVRHHLRHEPVSAGPPSKIYRTRKFIRRHRFGVAAGTIAAAALIAVAAITVVQAGRIARERDRANQEAEAAKQAIDFLTGLFKVSDPSESRGNAVTAREILDQGALKVESELAGQPEVQGRLMTTMGTVFQSLGLYKDSGTLLRKSLEIRRRVYGDRHVAVAESLHNLGVLEGDIGDYAAAERSLSDAAALREALLPRSAELAETIGAQAGLAHERGEFPRAESLQRRRLEIVRALPGRHDAEIGDALNDLAMAIEESKADYKTAKVLLKESLTLRQAAYGKNHPLIAQSLNNLAMAHYRDQELDAAEPLFREALAMNRTVYGSKHREIANLTNNLGLLLRDRGNYRGANEMFAESVRINRELVGPNHLGVAIGLTNWGESVRRSGDFKAAASIFREVLAIYVIALPNDPWQQAGPKSMLAMCLVEQKQFREAEELVTSAYRSLHERFPDDHPRVQRVTERAVSLYDAWGKREQAAEWRAKLTTNK